MNEKEKTYFGKCTLKLEIMVRAKTLQEAKYKMMEEAKGTKHKDSFDLFNHFTPETSVEIRSIDGKEKTKWNGRIWKNGWERNEDRKVRQND